MNRSFDQRAADSNLSTYRYRLEVRGGPRTLTWPDVCANCGAGAVLLAMTFPTEFDRRTAPTDFLATWRLSSIFLFGIAWMIGITWWMSRPDRFEPLSEITSACTVSVDVNLFFESRRHVYGFRNQPFAEAFELANQERVWTERDQERMWKMSLVATILLIVVFGGGRLLLWYVEGR